MKRPSLLATAFTIAGVGVLLGLGTWQLNKYLAKSYAPYTAEICRSAKDQDLVIKDFQNLEDNPATQCARAIYEGLLQSKYSLPVGFYVHDGTQGHHRYAFLKSTENGSHLLVNLGWSSIEEVTGEPEIAAKIQGALIKPKGANAFSLRNKPEKNEWHTIDIKAFAGHHNLDNVSEYVLFAEDIKPQIMEPFVPAKLPSTTLKPENHLQYAGFWYFMALALGGIFYLRFLRNDQAS